ncbi:hypothetical protein AKO1_011621 [Acrasis kona]|uniref:EGF-like domain-containing protein n=1 Tax=Acrasis kona TaxID=1008807 RepID=A0AAW2Z7C4_9EUKA
MGRQGVLVCSLVFLLSFAFAAYQPYPKGIVMDVEVHTLPNWSTNQTQLSNDFLDFVEWCVNETKPHNIPIWWAIPRWYDSSPILVPRRGVTKTLSAWVQDITNVLIMDYSARNYIADAMGELQYSLNTSTKVRIALDVSGTWLLSPPSEFERVISNVVGNFTSFPTFDSVSIENYKYWVPTNPQPTLQKRDVFVWERTYVTNTTEQAKLYDFLNYVKNVNAIYIQNQYLVGTTQANYNLLKKFINDTYHSCGVHTELLSGDPKWSVPGADQNQGFKTVTNSVKMILEMRPVCFGIDVFNSTTCSSNGACVANDTCVCNKDFSGDNCQFWSCGGVSKNVSSVCSGHGICKVMNVCVCDAGFNGTLCEVSLATPTQTSTLTPTQTSTITQTQTQTPTLTSTQTPTQIPTSTQTPGSSTDSPVPTPYSTSNVNNTATPTPTPTVSNSTQTPTPTFNVTQTPVPSNTTQTPTPTPSSTIGNTTATRSPTPAATLSSTLANTNAPNASQVLSSSSTNKINYGILLSCILLLIVF